MIRAMAAGILAVALGFAQVRVLGLPPGAVAQETGPRNLDFEAGQAGQVPPGWEVAQLSRIEGYLAATEKRGCRTGKACAVIAPGPQLKNSGEGLLYQPFDGVPYRGKKMRLRAWVRLEGGRRGDRIRVVFTVDGEKSSDEYVQSGGAHSSEWTLAEVKGKAAKDAIGVHIGVVLTGQGRAWVDDVTFEEAN